MASILLKSGLAATCAALASLVIIAIVAPSLGGAVDHRSWLLAAACATLIAWPASAFTIWQNGRLKTAHRDLARTHAQLAAAHRRLEDRASRDEMTGMLKREAFFERLDASRDDAVRGALLIIDADHFKQVNDGYGHLAGDDALREIAAAIRRGVRVADILGRIGGEEFVAFLIGATSGDARRVAERIRAEVEMVCFEPERGARVSLTVSIGGVQCRRGASTTDLMRAADRRLYEAKRRGRNRAVLGPVDAAA